MLRFKRLLDLTQLPLETGQEATDVDLPLAKSGSASSAQSSWGQQALSDGGQTVYYDVAEIIEKPRTLKKKLSVKFPWTQMASQVC